MDTIANVTKLISKYRYLNCLPCNMAVDDIEEPQNQTKQIVICESQSNKVSSFKQRFSDQYYNFIVREKVDIIEERYDPDENIYLLTMIGKNLLSSNRTWTFDSGIFHVEIFYIPNLDIVALNNFMNRMIEQNIQAHYLKHVYIRIQKVNKINKFVLEFDTYVDTAKKFRSLYPHILFHIIDIPSNKIISYEHTESEMAGANPKCVAELDITDYLNAINYTSDI
jgi:hypothetical protein